MKRISISINPQIKEQLIQLAKANYRTLNGEISKALEFYILSQGDEVTSLKDSFTTPTNILETSRPPQTEAVEQPSAPIYQYEEVEEF